MILLDTDVLIDMLRRHPAALAWLESLGTTPLLLPGYVVMEVLQGCQNKAEQHTVVAFLQQFAIQWPSAHACDAAVTCFAQFRLSHGLGMIDSLIGQTALELAVPLYTFNQKHYACIPGLITIQPYLH